MLKEELEGLKRKIIELEGRGSSRTGSENSGEGGSRRDPK